MNKPKISVWRFWLPLIFQTSLILIVPIQVIQSSLSGKTVILETTKINRDDLLRGDSQQLRYEISSIDRIKEIEGWENLEIKPGDKLYVIVEAPTKTTMPPMPWVPVKVSSDRPLNLPANQVALQGRYKYTEIDYGFETYYLPEDKRKEIDRNIYLQKKNTIIVEVKVDNRGQAVPISIWVGDNNYKF